MTNGLEKAKMAITEVCEALKTSDAIPHAIDAFRDFLLEKNKAYGNSIYEPVRVFTSASIDSLILVRLNDKATRLLKGESGGEDSFDDLLGYLILRKALPLYLTWDTKEGQEALDALHCGGCERAPVPGSVVTASLANRGLRVGMTFQEVRDNQWTQCEGGGFEHPASCTEGDPCSACKLLYDALCKCGHSYMLHNESENCVGCDDGCGAFSLDSWANEPLPQVATNIANAVNAAGVPWTAIPIDDGSEHGAVTITADEPKKEPTNKVDAGTPADYRATHEKKPRINRATWHETNDGKHAIDSVLGFLIQQPIVSWSMGELTKKSGLDRSDVQLAIAHLISTGAIVNHGRAKGTRYAVAGFTDWPAPRERKGAKDAVSDAEPSEVDQ